MSSMSRGAGLVRLVAGGAAAIVMVAACGSTSSGGGGAASNQPPTAGIKPQSSVGPGEGALNLVAWSGYLDPSWVNPFQQQTGCQINSKYANSSDEMVSLLANGGGGQWDMVSASGDADLRLIYAGDVKPMNTDLIPDWKNFGEQFKSPAFNTINGVHYGISLQWGPNVLLYNKTKFPTAPTSWSTIYDPANSGQITVPNNPIQIADAALYLMKHQPSLNITDPYELKQNQFDAAVALLKQQRPLIKKYWGQASDEISLFQNGDVSLGAAWPYQTSTLLAANAPVADTIPSEGATGWVDTWMLAAKAPHPNCAYLWERYISSPTVQAMQATNYGETPVNTLACPEMDKIVAGSCAQYHANGDAAYFSSLKFWKTPIADCGDGTQTCLPYSKWQSAWTSVTG